MLVRCLACSVRLLNNILFSPSYAQQCVFICPGPIYYMSCSDIQFTVLMVDSSIFPPVNIFVLMSNSCLISINIFVFIPPIVQLITLAMFHRVNLSVSFLFLNCFILNMLNSLRSILCSVCSHIFYDLVLSFFCLCSLVFLYSRSFKLGLPFPCTQ